MPSLSDEFEALEVNVNSQLKQPVYSAEAAERTFIAEIQRLQRALNSSNKQLIAEQQRCGDLESSFQQLQSVFCEEVGALQAAVIQEREATQRAVVALRESEVKRANMESAKLVLEQNLQETGGQLAQVERELTSLSRTTSSSSSPKLLLGSFCDCDAAQLAQENDMLRSELVAKKVELAQLQEQMTILRHHMVHNSAHQAGQATTSKPALGLGFS